MNSEKKMRDALDLLLEVHDTPCRFDHNGYCQEHYLDHAVDGCRVQLAREALAAPADEQVGLTDAISALKDLAEAGEEAWGSDRPCVRIALDVIAAHEAKRNGGAA